jgi:uncharacterized protein YjdB
MVNQKNNSIHVLLIYKYYEKEKGTLKYELSDDNVHLGNNEYFLNKFMELYETI